MAIGKEVLNHSFDPSRTFRNRTSVFWEKTHNLLSRKLGLKQKIEFLSPAQIEADRNFYCKELGYKVVHTGALLDKAVILNESGNIIADKSGKKPLTFRTFYFEKAERNINNYLKQMYEAKSSGNLIKTEGIHPEKFWTKERKRFAIQLFPIVTVVIAQATTLISHAIKDNSTKLDQTVEKPIPAEKLDTSTQTTDTKLVVAETQGTTFAGIPTLNLSRLEPVNLTKNNFPEKQWAFPKDVGINPIAYKNIDSNAGYISSDGKKITINPLKGGKMLLCIMNKVEKNTPVVNSEITLKGVSCNQEVQVFRPDRISQINKDESAWFCGISRVYETDSGQVSFTISYPPEEDSITRIILNVGKKPITIEKR